jgi:hypothetical protein
VQVFGARVREEQITNKSAEEEGLLDVLLPEVRAVGLVMKDISAWSTGTSMKANLDGVEELRDDSGDAPEEGRAGAALHLVAETLDLDERTRLRSDILCDSRRIHLSHARQEDGRGVGFYDTSQELKIACKRAWVGR